MKKYTRLDEAIIGEYGQEVYNRFVAQKMETISYLDELRYLDLAIEGKYLGYYHEASGWVYVGPKEFEALFLQINGYTLSAYFENSML